MKIYEIGTETLLEVAITIKKAVFEDSTEKFEIKKYESDTPIANYKKDKEDIVISIKSLDTANEIKANMQGKILPFFRSLLNSKSDIFTKNNIELKIKNTRIAKYFAEAKRIDITADEETDFKKCLKSDTNIYNLNVHKITIKRLNCEISYSIDNQGYEIRELKFNDAGIHIEYYKIGTKTQSNINSEIFSVRNVIEIENIFKALEIYNISKNMLKDITSNIYVLNEKYLFLTSAIKLITNKLRNEVKDVTNPKNLSEIAIIQGLNLSKDNINITSNASYKIICDISSNVNVPDVKFYTLVNGFNTEISHKYGKTEIAIQEQVPVSKIADTVKDFVKNTNILSSLKKDEQIKFIIPVSKQKNIGVILKDNKINVFKHKFTKAELAQFEKLKNKYDVTVTDTFK